MARTKQTSRKDTPILHLIGSWTQAEEKHKLGWEKEIIRRMAKEAGEYDWKPENFWEYLGRGYDMRALKAMVMERNAVPFPARETYKNWRKDEMRNWAMSAFARDINRVVGSLTGKRVAMMKKDYAELSTKLLQVSTLPH